MITLLKAIHFPFSRALELDIAADTPIKQTLNGSQNAPRHLPRADLRVHFFMAFTAFGEVARLAYLVAFIAFDRAAALTRRVTK